MNNRLRVFWICVIIAWVSILSFLAGMIAHRSLRSQWSVLYGFLPFVLAAVGILFALLVERVYRQKYKSHTEELLGAPVTILNPDGSYVLNPADLYEAIEKLGYIEHEWKGENLNGSRE